MQAGYISISSYPSSPHCVLMETPYTFNTIYVVHTLNHTGVNTVQFKIRHNWSEPLLWEVNYIRNLHIGNIFTGVTVTYVGCKTQPHLIVQMTFLVLSPTPGCRVFEVVPDPAVASGEIEVVDCNYNVLYATGGFLCVNEPDCWCVSEYYDPPAHCQPPVSTEETTWGSIKALYR